MIKNPAGLVEALVLVTIRLGSEVSYLKIFGRYSDRLWIVIGLPVQCGTLLVFSWLCCEY